jgi:HTH-type transcriptional regulator/antitoxin HipB
MIAGDNWYCHELHTGAQVNYSIKTLSQLPLILKGFRKERRLTQAAMAEKLGITQQSYAYFEANPAAATLDRVFMVLRLLGVEISLDQTVSDPSMRGDAMGQTVTKKDVVANRKSSQTAPAVTAKRKQAPNVLKPARVQPVTRKNESW